jgi:hypothetical protein
MKMKMTKKKKIRVDLITLFTMVCAIIWFSRVFTCMFHQDTASSKFVDHHAGDEAHKPWMRQYLSNG